MPQALTSARISILRDHVNAGDRIAYYEQLAEWGYRYGALAVGVVTQETFSGKVANIFNEAVANRSGVLLMPNDFGRLGIDLMIRDFNARIASGSPALRGEELPVTTIQNYHAAAFDIYDIPITAWTPFRALQAQPNQAAREDLWDRLLSDSYLGSGAGYAEILIDSIGSGNAQYLFDLSGASGEAILTSSGAYGGYNFARTIGGNTSYIVGGGTGADRISLSNNGDVALGFAGNDTIIGGNGADRLYGGQGTDSLTGGLGADVIDGGAGGADIYVDSRDAGARDVLINIERIQGSGDGSYSITNSFSNLPSLLGPRTASIGVEDENQAEATADTAQIVVRGDAVIGTAMRDGLATLDIDADGHFVFANVNGEIFLTIEEFNFVDAEVFLEAGREADAIRGTAQHDSLRGTNGVDLIVADDGNDIVFGGGAADEISGEGGADRIFGEDGADRLFGDRGEDQLYGGRGADLLVGGSDHDQLFGQEDNDILVGGHGNDSLFGSAGFDTLLGGSGDDMLFGDAGDDVISGGGGADRIFLGSGNDVVLFADGHGKDQVFGFGDDDRFEFSFASISTFEEVMAFASGSASVTKFDFDDETQLTVYGIGIGELSSDHFLFA